ncbi:hypothetical protein AB0J25_00040 [Streptomyces sp. NPDC049910]|uniref:hypothetical protein n=1 Tax=Streptomyces sp. NPDC049910 TaxID=3155278 RepID=UPI00342E07CB
MDTQNPSVRPHAQSRISGKIHPRRPGGPAARPAGVIHDNTRHTSHFTVIGNHLAQHRELSGLAIGLGVHIQSLKAGSLVDIRTLAGRFPEGQARIAAALRELEVHGYLRRPRERTPSGRMVTRTISCNQPGRPMLLVVCQDRATAEWAARPVRFGPPQWPLLTLRPLVAGPHNMPVLTDPADVRKDLALATLSAITQAANPDIGVILKAMTNVLRDTPAVLANPIVELIAQGLGTYPASETWRKLVAVDLSFYKSPLSEELRDEGRAEGEARRAAEDVLDVLAERGIAVPEAVRERVVGCGDPDTLRRWLRRAVTAPSADAIFADE